MPDTSQTNGVSKLGNKISSEYGKMNGATLSLILAGVIFMIGVNHSLATEGGNTPKRYPVLAACTRFEHNIFKEIDFSAMEIGLSDRGPLYETDVGFWKKQYHELGAAVIKEHMKIAYPVCTSDTYGGLLAPRSKLAELAKTLPSWRVVEGDDEIDDNYDRSDNFDRLTQMDVGTVLLEYLRMYECALVERNLFLFSETLDQETRRRERMRELKDSASPSTASQNLTDILVDIVNSLLRRPLEWARVMEVAGSDRETILNELIFARKDLHRVLTLIGGLDRMRLINTEIVCLQKTSLDIRNSLALAADASSCLPRIWNAKDPLRDFEEQQE